jgi:replication factor C small subunit
MSYNELWTEKYRPQTIEDYVWTDNERKQKFVQMLKEKNIPNLFFSGEPGTGKTSLARLIFKELNVSDADILEINASLDNGIDIVRNKISNFASTWAIGDKKYVLLDEIDNATPSFQSSLKNLMETYSDSTRFILTANIERKIIPPLKSRCQHYHFEQLNKDEFTTRIAQILFEENINLDGEPMDVLDSYVRACYPDMRKTINLIQQNTLNGVLKSASQIEKTSDYLLEVIELFKQGKINLARRVIVEKTDNFIEAFTWIYKNLDILTKNEEKQDQILLAIRNGMVNDSMCAVAEINFSATMVEIADIIKGK